MSEITLITAYFNIGRKNWTGFCRGDEQYIAYFKHWARMRNQLVVYTSAEVGHEVMKIRDSFGLASKTKIIPIEDVTSCAPDIFQKIKKVMTNKESWRFHKRLNHPESWNYYYNYVTGLKPYFAQDAVAQGYAEGMTAWIDFGFCHGANGLPSAEHFDFLWTHPFSSKIHIFSAIPLDDAPIFSIVRDMTTYLRGGIIAAPAELWPILWDLYQEAITSLSDCGLADDDQTLMLMAYRKRPDLFEVHPTDFWNSPLIDFSDGHLRGKKNRANNPPPLRRKIQYWIHSKYLKWDIIHRHGSEIEKKHFQ